MAGMPNVFVIMADALRADRLHCYGNPMETSPGIDRLAREGVRFRWAMAHSANTMPCVVSAFTGLDPLVHGLNDPRTHVRHSWKGWSTPFDLLEQKGYAISGDDAWLYYHLGRHQAAKNPEQTLAFLEENRRRPWFVWRMPDYTHLPYNPTAPYDTAFLPAGYRMSEDTRRRLEVVKSKMIIHRPGLISKYELDRSQGALGDTWGEEILRDMEYQRTAGELQTQPEDRPAITALYDGRVRMLDEEVGRYIEKLEELGQLDNTIFVVTGDHGEELMERGAIGHSSCSLEGTLYDEAVHIPLILRYPPALEAGNVVEMQISQFDIMPTLFGLLGLQMPKESAGRPLRPVIEGAGQGFLEETYAMTLPCGWQVLDNDQRRIWSLRTPVWKLLFYDYAPQAESRYELFNLTEDPGEKHSVFSEQPAIAAPLQRKLHLWRSSI